MDAQRNPERGIATEYTVEEKDTIPEIERKLGISWQEIYENNRECMPDPQTIRPGLKLMLPRKEA